MTREGENGISMHAWRLSGVALLVSAAALLALPSVSVAAVIAPNTTDDDYDMAPDATCSLREAVQSIDGAANFGGCTAAGAYNNDTIQLAPGTYELTIPGTGGGNESGDLDFNDTLTIEGLPGGPVVIDANGIDRVITFTTSLTISGLTLTGGFVEGPGPVTSVGGAIVASGGSSLTILNSTISGNQNDGGGAGIAARGPTSLTNVTISGNTATDDGGGGIDVSGAAATLSLESVTISGNIGLETHNPAKPNVAGGIVVISGAGAVSAHNSIVSGNSTGSTTVDAPDCQGTIGSTGGNVIGDTSGCSGFTSMASDELDMPALLSPLGDFGGATQTHALLVGSPAIDNGVATCQMLDQRGISRAQGASCDAGAYELVVGDTDRDGIADAADNCPATVNPGQQDNDGDGVGNACDPTPNPLPPAAAPLAPQAAPVPPKKKCKKRRPGATAAKKKCKRKKR